MAAIPHLKIIKAKNGYVVFIDNSSESEQAMEATGAKSALDTLMKQFTSPEAIQERERIVAKAFENAQNYDETLENIRKANENKSEGEPVVPVEVVPEQKPFLRQDTECYIFPDETTLLEFIKSLLLS